MDINFFNTFFESVDITATAGGASGNVLYTCPNNYNAEVTLLCVTNDSASTASGYIQFYHSDDATYHNLAKNHTISGNDTYHFITSQKLYLHAGDKIVVYMDSGNTLEASISGKEYVNRTRKT